VASPITFDISPSCSLACLPCRRLTPCTKLSRFRDELQSSVKSCKQVIDLDHASVQHSLHRMGAMSRLDATASSFYGLCMTKKARGSVVHKERWARRTMAQRTEPADADGATSHPSQPGFPSLSPSSKTFLVDIVLLFLIFCKRAPRPRPW
jgi:hypothetical protein